MCSLYSEALADLDLGSQSGSGRDEVQSVTSGDVALAAYARIHAVTVLPAVALVLANFSVTAVLSVPLHREASRD